MTSNLPAASGPLRVLVLEDVPTDAELMERELRRAGREIESHRAANRDGFLHALASFSPDIVLADYCLPGFDGLEAIRLAKQHDPDLPVVVVTASLDEQRSVECIKRGAADYVLKDRLFHLPAAIDAALEARRAREAVRAAASALRASETHLRAIFRAAPVGMGVTVGRVLKQVNQRLCDMVGYSPEELLEHDAQMLYPTLEEYDRVGREKESQLHEQAIGSMETRWKRRDGRVIDVLLSASLLDPDDPLVGLTFAALDISDRKRAEAQAEVEKAKAQNYLDIAASLVVALDRDGNITLLNREGARILQTRREEALGKNWFDTFLAEEMRDEVRGIFRRLVAGDPEPTEYVESQIQTAGGEIRFVRWHNRPLRDETGEIVGTLSSGQDVTEWKRLDEALLSLATGISGSGEDFFRSVALEMARVLRSDYAFVGELEPGPIAERIRTLGVCADGSIASDFVYELTGSPCEDVVNDGIRSFSSGVAGRFPRDRLLAEMGIEGYLGAPLRNSGGRTLGIVAALYRQPARQIRASESLIRLFAVRAAHEIEQMRAEQALLESERMATMGTVVGAVAHEVRNPLFALSATVDALEARFGAREDLQRYLPAIRQQVDRLADLMRDLLDYGRPAGPKLAPGSLGTLVRESVDWCRLLAEKHRVTLQVAIPADLPPALVDASRLERAFRNVVENAIHHSPEGGTVSVEAACETDRGFTCVVRDSGPGFAREDVPRVFEPFFTRRRGGTGLGLAIAWRIVQEHGGTIAAANAPGGGGMVTVGLPLPGRRESGC